MVGVLTPLLFTAMKTCACCKQTKSTSEFSKDSKRRDGLQPYCKVCSKEKRKAAEAKNRLTRTTSGEKACTRCGTTKPVVDFPKSDSHAGGWHTVCRTCLATYGKTHYEANLESRKAQARRDYHDNKSARQVARRAWRNANKALVRQRNKAWRLTNADRVRKNMRSWSQENAHRKQALEATRRAKKLQATPTWSDNEVVLEYYRAARALNMDNTFGIKWHVDHIVPLNHPLVCGLHSHTNMQLLPAAENLSKGNRSWPDMPNPL